MKNSIRVGVLFLLLSSSSMWPLPTAGQVVNVASIILEGWVGYKLGVRSLYYQKEKIRNNRIYKIEYYSAHLRNFGIILVLDAVRRTYVDHLHDRLYDRLWKKKAEIAQASTQTSSGK